MKLIARTQTNTIKIFDEENNLLATFTDEGRGFAYGLFLSGIVAHNKKDTSLFDERTGEYIFGTLDQLLSKQP